MDWPPPYRGQPTSPLLPGFAFELQNDAPDPFSLPRRRGLWCRSCPDINFRAPSRWRSRQRRPPVSLSRMTLK